MHLNPYANQEKLPFMIAEIGINHNGDVEIAKKLIDMAKECGADAVKFQKRTIDIVYTKELLDSPRQSPWGMTQRAQKEGLELGKKEYDEIHSYCREKEIYWFASAWDEKSQEFLRQYDLLFNKIASTMLTHKILVDMVVEEGKHTFISTGMSNFEQIDRVVSIFEKKRCPYTLMHCISVYPCPDEWCNVEMIKTLKDKYKCPVGYSGHEAGVLPSVLATTLGAVAIERHITIDRTMYGSDQSSSLEKHGLELVMRDTRRVKQILGSGKKIIIPEEEKVAYKLRYFREDGFRWHEE
ncbi:MAG: N-acetylneuraminate synthase [Candidatus Schekmanbacteria bacterium RIFCSPHIGHO2_02_FULL_38_11]|uniref:N-acetylneuraminate synthase n=1 Tax=Candidatus Schekmanbacteria bacterium RIFCSPLOWO2_12_FULL_38_15 TaxID=1817883 RepID=A0A1F7SKU9_9BACT|nr:MAG: N-acetylneuraminate synthase [Candidatus Schekmanbacteria bacterium RIFCSPLOWO2_02_FULL_38_14]OGL51349.1 MAG: N-acetylneuraminate synthase [Candidatus Schekmanbacteria bacterium RIFCSPHIGHO2_02_FULL_38_11]OGL54402.1 MAG: N-acetylneuraminate synthase [Candidatus Schekmanbacteria bacterium RIFCSPLOWO2_12_FULL_38_15]